MFRRLSLLAIAPVAVALVIAGCGSSNSGSTTATTTTKSSSTSSGQGHVIKLSADPGGQLRFSTAKLTAAKPGKITLVMANPASAGMDHGISIEGNGVDADGPIVAAGKTSTVTATLKKGTYTYYCPVPGHKQAGMVGTLTVQ
jgi:plastocyanin